MTQNLGQISKVWPQKNYISCPNLTIFGLLPAHIVNGGGDIAFENGTISNFQGLMTLTLNQVIRHTIVHQSSTSSYMPNFIEIEKTVCGRTDGC